MTIIIIIISMLVFAYVVGKFLGFNNYDEEKVDLEKNIESYIKEIYEEKKK